MKGKPDGTAFASFAYIVPRLFVQGEKRMIMTGFWEKRDISMKHIVTALLIASLCAFGLMAVAEKAETPGSSEYGETMSHLILHERSVFSGLILETNRGTAITTNRGTFLLKGLDLRELVGNNVRVTGVIRDGSIFALKIGQIMAK
jgi:hypothetical protein